MAHFSVAIAKYSLAAVCAFGLVRAQLLQAENAAAPLGEAATVLSTDFKSPSDCAPVEACRLLKAGDLVTISGFIKVEGKDLAVVSHNGTAITILKSYLNITGPLVAPDAKTNMPVVKPDEDTAKSPIIITPDSDVEYK